MNKNIRFGYFQAKTIDGTGYICVALYRPPKGSSEEHRAGFSFCSPKDFFNKSLARKIAVGRLENGCDVSFKSTASTKEACVEALRYARRIPSWVVRAIKKQGLIVGLTQWHVVHTPTFVNGGSVPETVRLHEGKLEFQSRQKQV